MGLKPIDESIKGLKPIDEDNYLSETAKNLPSDLWQNVKSITPGLNIYEGYKAGQGMAKMVAENRSVIEPNRGWKMLGEQVKENVVPMYTHPIESFKKAPVSTAMAWLPTIKPISAIAKGGLKSAAWALGGGIEKAGTAEVPINTAKRLAQSTGLQHSVVEDLLTNKDVQSVATNATPEMVEDLGADAAKKYSYVMSKGIKEADDQIYKNAGVTDDMIADVSDVAPSINNKVASFKSISLKAPTALKTANRAWERVQEAAKNNWQMTYGELKELKNEIFDAADEFRNERTGALTKPGQLLWDIGMDFVKAQDKNTALELVANKFQTLLGVRHDMGRLARMPIEGEAIGTVKRGEAMLEHKVFGRTLDKGNVNWKKDLESVGERLASVPESAHLADIVNDFKKAWAADSIVKAEKSAGSVNKLPFPLSTVSAITKKTGLTSPTTAAQIIKRGAQSGRMPVKKILERALSYKNPLVGRQMDTIRSMLESGYAGEMARNLPLGIGTAVKGMQTASQFPVEAGIISALTNISRGAKHGNTKH